MGDGWETVRLDDLDSIPVSETLVWRPIRRRLDIGAFGINAYTAANEGDELVEDHTEEANGHEEVYFVLSGRADFTLGGETLDAPAGTFVFIRDPAVRRAAVARERGSTVLAIGGPRAEAFRPSAWEHYFMAIPHAKAGDFRKAVEVVKEGEAEHGEHPGFLYNLACYEAQAGDLDEAVEHATKAFELDPSLRDVAETDSDLDGIRDRLSP
jgi:tetratricopeptide (TPR) repeat protein